MIVFRRRLQVRWKQGLAKSRLEAQRCRAVPLSHSHEQVFSTSRCEGPDDGRSGEVARQPIRGDPMSGVVLGLCLG